MCPVFQNLGFTYFITFQTFPIKTGLKRDFLFAKSHFNFSDKQHKFISPPSLQRTFFSFWIARIFLFCKLQLFRQNFKLIYANIVWIFDQLFCKNCKSWDLLLMLYFIRLKISRNTPIILLRQDHGPDYQGSLRLSFFVLHQRPCYL